YIYNIPMKLENHVYHNNLFLIYSDYMEICVEKDIESISLPLVSILNYDEYINDKNTKNVSEIIQLGEIVEYIYSHQINEGKLILDFEKLEIGSGIVETKIKAANDKGINSICIKGNFEKGSQFQLYKVK
ncbi:MAG: hypothetical protein WBA54_03110, partial [Acidaminobacteraceae bacterium]